MKISEIKLGKRILLLLLYLLIFNMSITSQHTFEGELGKSPAKFAELEYLDQAMIEAIYEYSVTDTVLKRTEILTGILQVGSKKSKYFEYPMYQVDSVVYKRGIHNITLQEYSNIVGMYYRNDALMSFLTVLKNYPEKTITHYDRIFIDNFFYPDSVVFDWQLENDTLHVCGYPCRKARTEFRGRNWTAYYTEEIPVSDGPWKFSGLPGLILKVEDSENQHIFTAISIRNANSDIYVEKKTYFKTNRDRFNKQMESYKTDLGRIISGSPAAPKDIYTGKEIAILKRRKFFNPIELE